MEIFINNIHIKYSDLHFLNYHILYQIQPVQPKCKILY